MLPPSANKVYKTFAQGRIVIRRLSAEAEKFKTQAGIELGKQWMFEVPPRENTPLEVHMVFYFPILENKGWPKSTANRYKSQDVDNYIKLLLDVMKVACGVDDANVMVLHASKRVDSENPRIEVSIDECAEPE